MFRWFLDQISLISSFFMICWLYLHCSILDTFLYSNVHTVMSKMESLREENVVQPDNRRFMIRKYYRVPLDKMQDGRSVWIG